MSRSETVAMIWFWCVFLVAYLASRKFRADLEADRWPDQ